MWLTSFFLKYYRNPLQMSHIDKRDCYKRLPYLFVERLLDIPTYVAVYRVVCFKDKDVSDSKPCDNVERWNDVLKILITGLGFFWPEFCLVLVLFFKFAQTFNISCNRWKKSLKLTEQMKSKWKQKNCPEVGYNYYHY